jgi:hypothetical protein
MPGYSLDTAKVDPCPGCGVPVRRFANVPIAGTGNWLTQSGPWYCDDCIQVRCMEAVDG